MERMIPCPSIQQMTYRSPPRKERYFEEMAMAMATGVVELLLQSDGLLG
jgi:hypothetical protein